MSDDPDPLAPEDGVERFLALRSDSGSWGPIYGNGVTRINHTLFRFSTSLDRTELS